MVSKVLSVVGTVAVLGALAATCLGLWVLEDRITLVVAATAPPGQAPAEALLRDELASLRTQVEALQAALASNFESMGTALDERAAARHDATANQLVGLLSAAEDHGGKLRRQQEQLADLSSQYERLAQSLAKATAVSPEAPTSAVIATADPVEPSAAVAQLPVAPSQPTASERAPSDPAGVAATAPATDGVPPAKAAQAGRFLSFRMPTTGSLFQGLHEFVLLEELCRVGFDAKSTLHDFTGVTTQVDGSFRAQFDDPAQPWSGRVRCMASALDTGLAGRDENLREHLAVARFPTLEFTIGRAEPGTVDVAAERWQGVVHGTMTIRGKSRDVAMPIEITCDASKRLVLTGQTALRLSDYEVAVPSQLGGAISMQDEVKVWIALRARAKPGGGR